MTRPTLTKDLRPVNVALHKLTKEIQNVKLTTEQE